jgi:hypothetical protein
MSGQESVGKTNRAWHEQHRMPKNPTPAQRIAWHREHAENCACRPIPQGVLALMRAGDVERHAGKAKPAKSAKR